MICDFSIHHAAHIISRGGVIAYPTETIYGLGCNPYDADAVQRINRIKQRPSNKQFILLASELEQLDELTDINEEQKKRITSTQKPTSWIVPAGDRTPQWLTDADGNITIRITQQPVVKSLCRRLGHAIISTSANPSGKHPAQNSLQLHQYFHFSVDKILASHETLTAKPSTIIHLHDNTIIRA